MYLFCQNGVLTRHARAVKSLDNRQTIAIGNPKYAHYRAVKNLDRGQTIL